MQSGSSPLTRGKHAHLGCSSDQKRLIPAHAGKTSKTQPTSSPPQAHPHSRGENVLEPIRKTIQQGSSPLTRGKQRGSVYDRVQHGLIPTHAGKTLSRDSLMVLARAHPHSRGENTFAAAARTAVLGSSPLTRGKPGARAVIGLGQGLIPTHAGKTLLLVIGQGEGGAHPHSRGENLKRLENFTV